MADLFHRVSIRKFKAEAVSNEDIGYILEAAMAAPSAKNQQPGLRHLCSRLPG